jgi:hypothetical protein
LENPAQLLEKMQQEFWRWLQLLFDDRSPGIFVRLRPFHALLGPTSEDGSGEMILRSKISMIQQNGR